ncbi:hypothetical protein B0A72_04865 [Flavobacterium pectinovorum]|uniref:Uncharacterized protein n=1 Tax=Flavobacterium pectinovorum TaxID=29533 RepID=A0AB36P578_9FLAO|nr:hypothetical protein B0A72_04865 [Flavobacterium pectinovorum]
MTYSKFKLHANVRVSEEIKKFDLGCGFKVANLTAEITKFFRKVFSQSSQSLLWSVCRKVGKVH